MNFSGKTLAITWLGPFSWPGFESTNSLPSVPDLPGVYLQTFEYEQGYLLYAAGITRRTASIRFKEHTRKYMYGEYNVLDLAAAQQGIRKEIWHGWGYAKTHQDEFEERKSAILDAVDNKLAGFRVFVTESIDTRREARILERIEAGVMNHLYQQPPPICDLPDVGMHLEPRLETEDVITLHSHCSSVLYGLPAFLEI